MKYVNQILKDKERIKLFRKLNLLTRDINNIDIKYSWFSWKPFSLSINLWQHFE